MEKEHIAIKNIFSKKRLFIIIAIFIFLSISIWGLEIVLNNNYQDKFLPNISIAGIDIGGLSLEDARAKLDKRIDFVNRRGFVYISPIKTVTINPNISAMNPADSVKLIVFWDVDKSLLQVDTWQNSSSFWGKARTFLSVKDFPLIYSWDRDEHQKILKESFSNILSEKKEASFSFVDDNDLQIVAENIGQTFDYDQALKDTQEQIENLISTDINLKIIEEAPLITSSVLEKYKTQILNISNRGDLYITFEEKDWNIPNDIWKNWLKLKQGSGAYYIGIDDEKFIAYLSESGISEVINIPVQDARFNLKDGKVTEFVSSQAGREIQVAEAIKNLEKILNTSGELELALTVEITKSTIQNGDVNDLGILEIIGTGESNFAGSPANRIHNITVGANALHGVLIKPEEEFSLLAALGEIDGEHGYKQELVIKDGRTIPEYGGGLCQIGTTVFRGTIASGLPVTERRNHSYRVSYYEPAGTDATIYNPWPDYKFKNDTGKHILIQSRIEGTKIYFDFWGSKDGRIAMSTQPEIYNIVAPPAKKVIKTTDIPVGTEKCTERAHNGADAKFNYSVQYPNQPEPVETTFYSHYTPWQEVCLLGVTAEELLAEQELPGQTTASTTPEQ
ncbi:MAG: VanW family protein [Patescibacteria group bacterium]|jgi:vancomycin resistance protein YoaR